METQHLSSIRFSPLFVVCISLNWSSWLAQIDFSITTAGEGQGSRGDRGGGGGWQMHNGNVILMFFCSHIILMFFYSHIILTLFYSHTDVTIHGRWHTVSWLRAKVDHPLLESYQLSPFNIRIRDHWQYQLFSNARLHTISKKRSRFCCLVQREPNTRKVLKNAYLLGHKHSKPHNDT